MPFASGGQTFGMIAQLHTLQSLLKTRSALKEAEAKLIETKIINLPTTYQSFSEISFKKLF